MGVLMILNARRTCRKFILVPEEENQKVLGAQNYLVVFSIIRLQLSLVNLPYVDAKMPHLHN